MKTLLLYIRLVQNTNNIIGRYLAWLTALMAIVISSIVIMRTFLGYNSIALQESVTYMHALVFMTCLAFTAQKGRHVRVDIFYRRFDNIGQAWINACGAVLFLLPFSAFIFWISWQFTLEAWSIREGSNNPGGIPAIYLMKTLIPTAGSLLFLRGIAEVIENLLTISLVNYSADDIPHSDQS